MNDENSIDDDKLWMLAVEHVEASYRASMDMDKFINFKRVESPKFSKLWRDLNENDI